MSGRAARHGRDGRWGGTPTSGHKAREEETIMMAFDEMEPEHMAFLYELYTRSAGDARQGVPYEVLIDALGFDERVTKRIQHELQREGLVELTIVPQMTTVSHTVMDRVRQQHHQQTIGM